MLDATQQPFIHSSHNTYYVYYVLYGGTVHSGNRAVIKEGHVWDFMELLI